MSTRRIILLALAILAVMALGSIIAGSWYVGPFAVIFGLGAIVLATYHKNH